VTTDNTELRAAHGLPPAQSAPKTRNRPHTPTTEVKLRGLAKILDDVNLDEDDPFGEKGTAIIVLRMAGFNVHQIVNKLQLDQTTGPDHVRMVLFHARKAAKLADVGPLLDHMAVPIAVDNLIEGLKTGDKDYTQAVLKGRGAFRNFERTEGDTKMSLEISVEGLDAAHQKRVVEGSVVGMPRVERAAPLDGDDDGA